VAELLHFVEKLSMVAAAIVDLLKRKSDDASLSEMPFSVTVQNFVQMYAIATEL